MADVVLGPEEVRSALDLRPGWTGDPSAVSRTVTLPSFPEAIAAVDRVALAAEELNHHPDILVHGWNKVRLSITNHSQGGLTEADFELARRIDDLD